MKCILIFIITWALLSKVAYLNDRPSSASAEISVEFWQGRSPRGKKGAIFQVKMVCHIKENLQA